MSWQSASPEIDGAGAHVVTYPLNSRWLTMEVIAKIANGLGLPTSGLQAETLLMIEGKLAEEEHKPRNVQMDMTARGSRVTLRDESGVILVIPANEGVEEKRELDSEAVRNRSNSEEEDGGSAPAAGESTSCEE